MPALKNHLSKPPATVDRDKITSGLKFGAYGDLQSGHFAVGYGKRPDRPDGSGDGFYPAFSFGLAQMPSQCGMVIAHSFSGWNAPPETIVYGEEVLELIARSCGYSMVIATMYNYEPTERLLEVLGFKPVSDYWYNRRSGNRNKTYHKEITK